MQSQSPETAHTVYSDPRRYGPLLDALAPTVPAISAVARNVIVHYRTSGLDLPRSTSTDINLRWLSAILGTDQARHPRPLSEPREPTARVQGCCRDHSLLCVGALRQHGIAARSRVGFAGYFQSGYFHDHVIVELWHRDGRGGRWRRFDPEIEAPREGIETPEDIPFGPGAPFLTAAEVWCGYRCGELDPMIFGVEPGSPISGPTLIQNYVLGELAHRQGHEMLLWDSWGQMAAPGSEVDPDTAALTDDVAALLVAADRGEPQAEQDLRAWYSDDPRLHPGLAVTRHSPLGLPPVLERVGEPPTPSDETCDPPGEHGSS